MRYESKIRLWRKGRQSCHYHCDYPFRVTILAGVPLILGMSGTEDIGVMSVLMGIMGFIMRACLKGFLSIVIAAEKYIERNRTIE